MKDIKDIKKMIFMVMMFLVGSLSLNAAENVASKDDVDTTYIKLDENREPINHVNLTYDELVKKVGELETILETENFQLYAAGVRFWPWHVFSGWWIGGKVQYQEYNRGGIRSAVTDEGDRYGAGLSAGFTYMLHPHLNVSVGAGVWGGFQRYTIYSCPVCGVTEESGEKTFLLPNDLALTLSYVF